MSKTKRAANSKLKQKYIDTVLERLQVFYTRGGMGQLVAYDPSFDMTFQAPRTGAGLLAAPGKPGGSLDGGHYAESWVWFSKDELPVEWDWDESLYRWRWFVEAVTEAYEAGPQLKHVAVIDEPSETRIGYAEHSNKIEVWSGRDLVEVFEAYDVVYPPMCIECLEDGHWVELDGRCPHRKRSYASVLMAAGVLS